MLQAVIFDLDGVIVSTDIYHYKAWQVLAKKYCFYFDEALNDRLKGISRAESLEIILEANNATVSQRTFKRIAAAKNRRYRKLLNQLTRKDILPGVVELLGSLKQNGIKTAIGSSSRNTPKILRKLKLEDAFDAVVDGNASVQSKPAPDIFLTCADALEVMPASCMVIEDAKAGITAAKTAGMTAVGVGQKPLPQADAMLLTLHSINAERLKSIYLMVRSG